MIDSHVIGSHIKEKIAGPSNRRTVRFYNSLMDKGREKEECFLSHLFKRIEHLDSGPGDDRSGDFIRPTYIIVEDLEESLSACKELGGEVLVGPKSMGPGSSYAIIRDPAGAASAVYQVGD